MTMVATIRGLEDQAKAIDVLSNAGITYHRAPGDRFIVPDHAFFLLKESKIDMATVAMLREQPEAEEREDDVAKP